MRSDESPVVSNEPRWKEQAARLQLAGCGMLVVCGPFLAFPEIVPSAVPAPLLLIAATAGCALGATLLGQSGRLPYVLWPLAGIALLAWLRSPNLHQAALLEFMMRTNDRISVDLASEATQHLAGFALGLLAMSVVASVSQSPGRLVLAAVLYSLVGTAALAVGLAGTSESYLSEQAKFFALGFSEWIPRLNLALPGLESCAMPLPWPCNSTAASQPDGWVNQNALGGLALLVAPVCLALVFVPVRRTFDGVLVRFIGIVSGTVSIFVLVISQSRSAWLAACCVLIVLVARSRRGLVRCVFGVGALVAGALLLFRVGLESVGSAGASSFGGNVELAKQSALVRAHIWSSALDELKTSPWVGIGINQFHVVADVQRVGFAPQDPTPFVTAHAHSIFIQLALDLGIIGLLLYGALHVLLLVRADRVARGSTRCAALIAGAAGLSLVGVHAFGLGDAVVLGARVGLFQWLASGLIIAAWHLQAAESTTGKILDAAGRQGGPRRLPRWKELGRTLHAVTGRK